MGNSETLRRNGGLMGDGSVRSIGIRFDLLAGEARAAFVSFPALHSKSASIDGQVSQPISSALLTKVRSLSSSDSTPFQNDLLESAKHELNSIATDLAGRLGQDTGDDVADDVLVIGCQGMGFWRERASDDRSYFELCDGARLAEELGCTIVDDFPGRDLARSGSGGPVETHGLWMLLADRKASNGHFWRGVLELGQHATRFSMVPPLQEHFRRNSTYSADICVGQRLLGELVARIDGKLNADSNDEYVAMAKRGRVIPELFELWSVTETEQRQTRRWSPKGLSPLPHLYALEKSIHSNAQLDDLLATGMAFIASEVANYVRHQISPMNPVGELFVMADGRHCKTYSDMLRQSLPEVGLRELEGLGKDRTLLAASVAALAMMCVWQIPVAVSHGGEVPRALGRITPGSPSNWSRVLHEMTSHAPWLLPLREAI